MELAQFDLPHLIRSLASARGVVMITLILSPKDKIKDVIQFIESEQKAAENMKSPAHRVVALSSLNSVLDQLKKYTQVPEGGLAIFCGTTNESQTFALALVPFKRPKHMFYKVDTEFHLGEWFYDVCGGG
jgi:peptide chain release factor subunit 1